MVPLVFYNTTTIYFKRGVIMNDKINTQISELVKDISLLIEDVRKHKNFRHAAELEVVKKAVMRPNLSKRELNTAIRKLEIIRATVSLENTQGNIQTTGHSIVAQAVK